MRVYGLIGYPLSHSFSKVYFTNKFEQQGLTDCRYELFPLQHIKDLPALLQSERHLAGLNVTIPYKQDVLQFLSERNDLVEKIHACNCIKITNGKMIGYNTDAIGFEASLKTNLLPHHDRALVLGTGGASKAVEYVLEKLGIAYRLVSRQRSADYLHYNDINPSVIDEYKLIINTTPVGMYPNVADAPMIPYDSLTPAHYLFDMVYNPEVTAFLQEGKKREAVVKNGYDMLVIQAEESWKIWDG